MRYRSAEIKTVAVIGAGLIGSAWAAYFAAQGLAVRLHDPSSAALSQSADIITRALADLAQLQELPAGVVELITRHDSLEEAVDGADYVQENAPEKLALKRELLARLDACLAPDIVIGSSTSSLRTTDMQLDCRHPERILVAHPFNPPHLVPLVELVCGEATSRDAQDAAYAFFERIGKAPIRVSKEATGHVANRMSSALWREAVHIVASGIASVEDVDRAIRFGPGLRWAVDGPHMLYHLGGGARGMEGYLEHLGPAQEARWAELGAPKLDPETQQALIEGVRAEAAGRDIDELAARRDRRLIALLNALGEKP